jgi:hypothetical protein
MLMVLLGIMVSRSMSLLVGGVADACWSGFDLALCLGVATETSYSWCAAVLTVTCLRKTVGDPAALRAGWRWPWIWC